MANKRTVVHALFTYRDSDGVQQTALRGQTVELTDEELKRAERLEAVGPEQAPIELRAEETVRQPLPPTEVLAVGEQADDVEKPEKPAARRTSTASKGS